MTDFNTNTDNNDTWLTPPKLIRALGEFDLDPCSPVNRPWDTAKQHYTVVDDGLIQPWSGRVWLNPPYGKSTFIWLDKLSRHPGGGIALVFARTETKGFQDIVFEKASSLFFFRGRIRFYRIDGTEGDSANAPSVLVSYTQEDTYAIVQARLRGDIQGKLVVLK